MADWNKRFIDVTKLVASWSKDKSVGVGAIIVEDNRILATGYNGFPSGCDDNDPRRHERPAKYFYTEHAERNAIFSAARKGIKTEGCTMFLMWFPCADCARAIIQSGIKRIVCYKPDLNDKRWGESFMASLEMLRETKIEIIYYEN